jgi:hypothetical protein
MTGSSTWVKAAGGAFMALGLAASGALGGSGGAATAAPHGPRTWEYVALGDSYSAGPLIPLPDPLGRGCVRSLSNYPSKLTKKLDFASETDVTCSAARTTHMRRSQTTQLGDSMPPQFDALTRTTDLVTVGIGGNDYGLFGSMLETCPRVAEERPRAKAPCRDAFTTRDGVDLKLRDTRRIGRRLGPVVDQIQARSPRATVLVVGYPRLLPERGTCPRVPFAAGDYRWADRVERSLNRHIRVNAEDAGATFVDLYPSTRGHDICARDMAWINGKDTNHRAFEYHPFERGMSNTAEQIHQTLVSLGLARL